MKLISGTTSKSIGKNLSNSLNIPLVDTKIKRFPDGELYVRILENIKNDDILLIQNTYPDLNIIELLLLQDTIKEAGANKIITIIPYFGYARQDKRFEDGEPISAQTLAQHISHTTDKVITVDPHKDHILKFFTVPALSCSALATIAAYVAQNKTVDMILAPDKGALNRAHRASEIMGCDYDYLEKKRLDGSTVQMKPKKLNAKGKNALIIDDIISTGGTMAKAIAQLKTQGANDVYVACTHGVFAGGAKQKLQGAGCDDIICTDTIEGEFSKIRIGSTIAEALSAINR